MRQNAPLRGWIVTVMLCLFMAVNFADKAAFGLAAIPIMREMHLTHTGFGLLGASFFALFSISALLAGFLGDRLSTKWLLAGMALVWTAAQLPLLAPLGLAAFFACRILLGAGEGPALPTALHAAYKWFPDSRRPFVSAIVGLGVPIGAAAAGLLVTRTIAALGWHFSLGVLGFASLIWCGVWLFAGGEPAVARPERAEPESQARIPLSSVLVNRTVIGITVIAFSAYWVSSLAIIWLPSFLETAARMTPATVGVVLASTWLLQVPLFPLTGLFSTYLSGRGFSSGVSRGALAAVSVALAGAAMLGLAMAQPMWLVVALAAVCLGSQVVAGTVLPPLLAEVVPPARRGVALGACVAVASLGGFLAPVIFGRVVDVAGSSSYRTAFLVSGALVIVGAIVAQMLVRPSEDRVRLQPSRASNDAPLAAS
jgi:MFS family permease